MSGFKFVPRHAENNRGAVVALPAAALEVAVLTNTVLVNTVLITTVLKDTEIIPIANRSECYLWQFLRGFRFGVLRWDLA